MKITELELKNYRNYSNTLVNFQDGINFIVGKNAQGKTKSPKNSKDKQIIKFGEEKGSISVKFLTKAGTKHIKIYLDKADKKSIKINNLNILKLTELVGTLSVVYFSPDELKLIKESPDERRRFMDIDLCQFDKNYFYTLHQYNQILQQRNKLLKTPDTKVLKDTIAIWNEQLSTHGAKIILSRLKLIEKLKIHRVK